MIPETFRTENNPLLCLTSAVVVVCFHGSGEDWCGSNCHSLYKCISQTCYPKLFWKSPKVGGVNRCSPPVGCLSVFSWFHVVSSHLTAFCSECLNRFILFQSRVQSCFTLQIKLWSETHLQLLKQVAVGRKKSKEKWSRSFRTVLLILQWRLLRRLA